VFNKIINYFQNSYKAWSNLILINNLDLKKKDIIFYVENSSDWAHLDMIVNSLKEFNKNVVKITSDSNDKYLGIENVFYIGLGSARTYLFRTIKAKSIIMTLPDLDSYYLKKSIYPVHYFYVFHSMVSTHRNYKEHAFDAYDTIFCVGEHHINEIRKTEKVYNLPKKKLIKYGYGRLDNLLEAKKKKIINTNNNTVPHVLIAPSWGKSSIVNHNLVKLIKILILENFKVTLRLHPMTKRHHPNLEIELEKIFAKSNNYFFDSDISSEVSLLSSDIMISEWSGAAIEYAFSRERPVIFIDTLPKINNLNWQKIHLSCFEEDIRANIGKIVSPEKISNIPKIISEILNNTDSWSETISNVRESYIFNIGKSGKIGAEIICKTLLI